MFRRQRLKPTQEENNKTLHNQVVLTSERGDAKEDQEKFVDSLATDNSKSFVTIDSPRSPIQISGLQVLSPSPLEAEKRMSAEKAYGLSKWH